MKWLPAIETLGGSDHLYMTRVEWGGARLHIFWRGDIDPDPHDHRWDFWTFPLVSYIEEVWLPGHTRPFHHVVAGGRLHFRAAEHRHRVVGAADGRLRPVVTVVWTGRKRRQWGFWREGVFIPWRDYFGLPPKYVGPATPRTSRWPWS